MKSWLDVVKGLKTEDGSETANSVEHFDSNKSNHMESTRRKRQPKGRQHRDKEGADNDLMSRKNRPKRSRCADTEGSRSVGPEGSQNAKPDQTRSTSKACRCEEESDTNSNFEIQGQHWPDRLHKPRTGSAKEAGSQIGEADRREPEDRWTNILQENIFGS